MHPANLLIVGFEAKTPPESLMRRIASGELGGVVLFARNIGELDEVVALNNRLALASPVGEPPLVVSVDQEGGRVMRFRPTLWPPMLRVASVGDLAYTEAVGRAIGQEVAALGFNLDYAPVFDVFTNPENKVIGDRAFGTSPEKVIDHALAFWRGLESSGVRGCAKHFPGHGDTAADSHFELPHTDGDEARLRSTELAPFAAAVKAGVGLFMTAHVVFPAIDSKPATLSKRWLQTILRNEMKFDGVILSDDLDMKAVADRWSVEDTIVDGLRAGCDAFLACRDPAIQDRAIAVLQNAMSDPELKARIERSLERLKRFRQTLSRGVQPDAWRALKLAEHAELAARA